MSCSQTAYVEPDRVGGSGVAEKPESQLDDNSMRVVGNKLNLKYDDGGIIFSEDTESCISVVRLIDDYRVMFDPVISQFSINGAEIALKEAELRKQSDDCRWYRLIGKESADTIWFVVNL